MTITMFDWQRRAERAEALNHEWNVHATHAGMAGSEFIDDPKRVFAHVRDSRALHRVLEEVKKRAALEAELARLTTLRPASDHDGSTPVLVWLENSPGEWHPFVTSRRISAWERWTPLPDPVLPNGAQTEKADL